MSSYTGGSSSSSSGGIGFVGLLTVAFIVLKLMGYITWSWLWVLSPVWISTLLVLAILIVCGIGYLIYRQIKKNKFKNRGNKK